jgi:hypothetical protein
MQFWARALVAILSAVGAGTVGFGLAWNVDVRVLFLPPGAGRDALFLTSIFLPGILSAFLVFRALSRTAPSSCRVPSPPG